MISIAMTTYNGEKYLREQLDSILCQTYSDFELIICDDCSKDSTVKILKEYSEKDKRLKFFVNKNNLGFIKNFEKSIKNCAGDYIALADQDDLWTKNHLEVLYNNIGNHYLICANAELVDRNGNSLNDFVRSPEFTVASDSNEQLIQQLTRNVCQGCTALFRKELLEHYFPNPPHIIAHDAWLADLACMMPEKNGISGLTYIPEVVLKYRQHGNNTVGAEKATLKRMLNHFSRSSFSSFKELNAFMENCDYSFMTDEKKVIWNETAEYIKNMCSKSTRKCAKKFWNKHCISIYAAKSKTNYIRMWYIKLFILFL